MLWYDHPMNKKYLIITGNRGFIGLNFISAINNRKSAFSQGYDHIICVDNNQLIGTTGIDWFTEAGACPIPLNNFLLENTYDINSGILEAHLPKENATYTILNFASRSHVDDSIKTPRELYVSNTSIVPSLIDMVGVENIEKFWHIRTDEEYGQLLGQENRPFEVGDPIRPRNVYSASKASQTLYLEAMEQTFGLNVGYFVLANQFGKLQHQSKMIPATIHRIIQGEPALIYGSGDQLREWTFVNDTIDIICDTMMSKKETDRIIHIADSSSIMTNNTLVTKVLAKLQDHGYKQEVKHIDDRLGHDFCYKIKPSDESYEYTKFDDIIGDVVEYYVGIWG